MSVGRIIDSLIEISEVSLQGCDLNGGIDRGEEVKTARSGRANCHKFEKC